MKTTKYIIVLVLLVFVGDRIIGWSMDKVFSEVYTGQTGGRVNAFLATHNRVNILAIGNSRCAHHVVVSQLKGKAYNLSHNGMDLNFHVGLLDQILTNESMELDTILLHIELHELFNTNTSINSDIQHLKHYHGENSWITSQINGLSRFEGIKYFFKTYKWNGRVLSIVNNRLKSNDPHDPNFGYEAVSSTERDSVNVYWDYERAVNLEPNLSKSPNQQFKNELLHLKKLCQRHNVKLICFTAPVYKPSKSGDALIAKARFFFKKNEIDYMNYSNLYDSSEALQSVWNWTDVEHLNNQGAILFTEHLANDLYNNNK